jgi:hypothetical protein
MEKFTVMRRDKSQFLRRSQAAAVRAIVPDRDRIYNAHSIAGIRAP